MIYTTDLLLHGAKLIAENDITIRQAANIIGVSKSTLHRYCSTELQNDSTSLYWTVKEKLTYHFVNKYKKGGEATKRHWINKKQESA